VILVDTFVAGQPKTKGSMSVRNRSTGALAESVAGSSRWRALVAGAVRDDYARRWVERTCAGPAGRCSHPRAFTCGSPPMPYGEGVFVWASFRLPVDPLQVRAGDLDKLLRNVLDALASDARNPKYNGGVIFNDNQVVTIVSEKLGPASEPGLQLRVTTGPRP